MNNVDQPIKVETVSNLTVWTQQIPKNKPNFPKILQGK